MEAHKAGEFPFEPKVTISNFQRIFIQFNRELELTEESIKRFEESNTDKDRRVLASEKGRRAGIQIIATSLNEEPDEESTKQQSIF